MKYNIFKHRKKHKYIGYIFLAYFLLFIFLIFSFNFPKIIELAFVAIAVVLTMFYMITPAGEICGEIVLKEESILMNSIPPNKKDPF